MSNVIKMFNDHTCTGCGNCITFCPYSNLSIKQGDLGFPVPDVKDSELCAGCNRCIKACPFSDEFEEDEQNGDSFDYQSSIPYIEGFILCYPSTPEQRLLCSGLFFCKNKPYIRFLAPPSTKTPLCLSPCKRLLLTACFCGFKSSASFSASLLLSLDK